MTRYHSRHSTVRVSENDRDDLSAIFAIRYTPGTPDRGPDMNCAGGYPGDPEDFELMSIEHVDLGCDTAWILANRWDDICEAARQAAPDLERDPRRRARRSRTRTHPARPQQRDADLRIGPEGLTMTYRRKRRRGVTVVRVGWQHPETEEDFEVECEVTAGSPEIRWGDNACPADPGEVEIIAVADEQGHDRPDLIPLVEKDFDSIAEGAFMEAAEASEPDPDDAWDRRDDR